MMLSGVLCCKQLVRRVLLRIMHIVLSPQSPPSVWPAWHKQCLISDRRVLSRITRGRKGGQRRAARSLRGWQTESEAAYPLSSDRQMSPLPAWPAADQGRARRLLKWRNLRAPRGASWSFDVQQKSRVWCWMSWGRERQPLQSVTKAHPDGESRRKSRTEAAIIIPQLCCERK